MSLAPEEFAPAGAFLNSATLGGGEGEDQPVVAAVRELTGGFGTDVVVDAVGRPETYAQAFYLRDLAGAFHSYYAAERFLVDDVELGRARVALLTATAQVLRSGLALLGVSAPEKM